MNPFFADRIGANRAPIDPDEERRRRQEAQLRSMSRAFEPEATRVNPDASGGSDPLFSLLRLGAEVAPVSGEILSAIDAKKQFDEGNYGMAALSALGAVPMVGMVGRTARVGGRTAVKAAEAMADQALPRLSALHNTTAENIAKSLDLGGFPVPSIAVVPEHVPFTDFGDITLIGKQSLGDPATSRVYSADAYTTRVPVRFFDKLTNKKAQEFWKNVTGKHGSRYGDDAFRALQDNMPDRALDVAYRSDDLVNAYRRQAGLPEIGHRASYSQIGENFDQWVREQFQPIMQNPKVKVSRKLRDWNLDNVAEAMSSKGRLTEGKNLYSYFNPEHIRADNAQIFRSLEPMRREAAARVRLDEQAYDAASNDLVGAMAQLAYMVAPHGSREHQFAVNALSRAAAGRGSAEKNILGEGLEFWVPPGIPKDAPNPRLTRALAEFDAAVNRFRDAPVKYFEAKPQRGVRFDEFAGAVVPEGTDAALIERLRNAGLQVEPYKIYGDSKLEMMREPTVERFRRLLNEQGGNTLFSLGALGAGLGAAGRTRDQ